MTQSFDLVGQRIRFYTALCWHSHSLTQSMAFPLTSIALQNQLQLSQYPRRIVCCLWEQKSRFSMPYAIRTGPDGGLYSAPLQRLVQSPQRFLEGPDELGGCLLAVAAEEEGHVAGSF